MRSSWYLYKIQVNVLQPVHQKLTQNSIETISTQSFHVSCFTIAHSCLFTRSANTTFTREQLHVLKEYNWEKKVVYLHVINAVCIIMFWLSKEAGIVKELCSARTHRVRVQQGNTRFVRVHRQQHLTAHPARRRVTSMVHLMKCPPRIVRHVAQFVHVARDGSLSRLQRWPFVRRPLLFTKSLRKKIQQSTRRS